MKRTLSIVLALVAVLVTLSLCGCSNADAPDPSKYSDYVCYDYHLACLDADEQKASTSFQKDDVEYTISYRKPAGESDEQFICALVRLNSPLATPDLVVMQNPNSNIDVFADWTIKKVELYCENLKNTKPLWEEDEPSKAPSEILNASTDAAVFSDLISFITDDDRSEKYIPNAGFTQEIPNDDYTIYIRIHFNESENIVWDSPVYSYVSDQTQVRYITIDKGRLPSGIAAPSSLSVSIEAYPKLSEWISASIDGMFN